MLCKSVLAFAFCFLMSYVCFTVCLLLGLLSFYCPFGFFFRYNTCVVYVFVFSSKSNYCAMCLMAKLACTVWLGTWFRCFIECRWPLLCHFRLLSFCCPFGFFFSYNTCVVYVFVFSSKSNCCAMCLMAKLACSVWLGTWFGCFVECRWPLLCHFCLFHFQV